jgi:hypothetical protein
MEVFSRARVVGFGLQAADSINGFLAANAVVVDSLEELCNGHIIPLAQLPICACVFEPLGGSNSFLWLFGVPPNGKIIPRFRFGRAESTIASVNQF